MLVLKGSLLGILMFAILFVVRFKRLFWGTMLGPGVASAATIRNVFVWLGLVGCILLGCAIVGLWPRSFNAH